MRYIFEPGDRVQVTVTGSYTGWRGVVSAVATAGAYPVMVDFDRGGHSSYKHDELLPAADDGKES